MFSTAWTDGSLVNIFLKRKMGFIICPQHQRNKTIRRERRKVLIIGAELMRVWPAETEPVGPHKGDILVWGNAVLIQSVLDKGSLRVLQQTALIQLKTSQNYLFEIISSLESTKTIVEVVLKQILKNGIQENHSNELISKIVPYSSDPLEAQGNKKSA